MKKYKLKGLILSLAAISAGVLVSCDNDLLETVPNDRLSVDVFWRTETDAKLAVNGLYTDLDSTNIVTWDALTDIAHTNQNFDVQAYVELGVYDGTSSKIYGEWKRAYRGIRATSYLPLPISPKQLPA
jgi:hypothetical protein